MIGPGSKVRWKKARGERVNQLAFLVMGDVVMTVVERHPKIGFKGQAIWKVRREDGYEDWVPEGEIWEVRT